jgi:hypothetical protein
MPANRHAILVYPTAASGVTVTSDASAWGFGAWVEVYAGHPYDASLTGVVWQVTSIPSVDTTQEVLFEIGFGATGAESTRAQIPYSVRNDTQVGYYLDASFRYVFPEPIVLRRHTRIAARVADGSASALTYEGVKIWLREADRLDITLENYFFLRVDDGMGTGEKIR